CTGSRARLPSTRWSDSGDQRPITGDRGLRTRNVTGLVARGATYVEVLFLLLCSRYRRLTGWSAYRQILIIRTRTSKVQTPCPGPEPDAPNVRRCRRIDGTVRSGNPAVWFVRRRLWH